MANGNCLKASILKGTSSSEPSSATMLLVFSRSFACFSRSGSIISKVALISLKDRGGKLKELQQKKTWQGHGKRMKRVGSIPLIFLKSYATIICEGRVKYVSSKCIIFNMNTSRYKSKLSGSMVRIFLTRSGSTEWALAHPKIRFRHGERFKRYASWQVAQHA